MDKTKCSIIFMLTENAPLSLEKGIIGHLKEMDDLPTEGEIFLIASSSRGVILGPYTSKGNQYFSENPERFYRGAPNPKLMDCHWLLGFETYDRDRGLLWRRAAEVMGVNPNTWAQIRQHRFSENQINALCKELLKANGEIDYTDGVVDVDDLYRDDQEWADFLREDRDSAQEAYGCSPEGMIKLMFNGDKERYRQWCERTDF